MQNRKRIILILSLIVVMGMTMLTGCGAEEDYLSWSKSEWTEASDEKKSEALKAVLIEYQPTLENDEASLTTAIETIKPSVATMFEQNPDMTLRDMVEQAQSTTNQPPDQLPGKSSTSKKDKESKESKESKEAKEN